MANLKRSGVSQKPSIPSIRPSNINEEIWKYLSAIKEIIENYEGIRGVDDDRILTRKDMKRIGLSTTSLDSDSGSYSFVNNLRMVNPIKTITSDYQLKETDLYIIVDTSAGNVIVNLIDALNHKGYDYTIIKGTSDSYTVTVVPYDSQTISGEVSQILYGEGDAMNIISDNKNWYFG